MGRNSTREGDVGFISVFLTVNNHPYLYAFQCAQEPGNMRLVPADTALDGRLKKTILYLEE